MLRELLKQFLRKVARLTAILNPISFRYLQRIVQAVIFVLPFVPLKVKRSRISRLSICTVNTRLLPHRAKTGITSRNYLTTTDQNFKSRTLKAHNSLSHCLSSQEPVRVVGKRPILKCLPSYLEIVF